MANKTDNSKPGLGVNFLPDFYQTAANKKFLQATIDQLYQPGTLTKTSGYIGRKNAKAATGNDSYVPAVDAVRQNYQLEPGIVITDSLGNTTFFKDYIDYINQLSVFGADVTNHARLNQQEMYSWDPHIDWDKFVHFEDYYWLPYGPQAITVHGQQQNVISTYTVTLQSEGNTSEFLFTPDGLTLNPRLKLYRGQTYHFNITSPGNPVSITTKRSLLPGDRYTPGVSDHGVTDGVLTFVVPMTAPNVLYYQSEANVNIGGLIEVYDINEDTFLDVSADILGKKHYTLSDGTELLNGMKVEFSGNVTPSEYASGQYYVEGVGIAIKLVPTVVLEIVSPYTKDVAIEFGVTPFDSEPFEDSTGFASLKDYVVINRASRDHNPWSRYNRWFHKDVINASAVYNNDVPTLDQNSRAIRPIIEFDADLKLFNLGTTAIADIDLVDSFTTDVFSIIEGATGYSIDGVQLQAGQRILFTADPDPLVKNNIYKVEFNNIRGSNQIHLEQISTPELNQVTLVLQGIHNQSQMYWYDGTSWIEGQKKTNTNQAPLFDVFDDNGASLGDTSVYTGSTFIGTKLFSYKVGNGIADTELGFPLSYLNVNNIGDIVFDFNFETDVVQYKKDLDALTKNVNTGYLAYFNYGGSIQYVNSWQQSAVSPSQAAIRIYEDFDTTTIFELDIFDDINNLKDLVLKVYVNGIAVAPTTYIVSDGAKYKKIKFNTQPALTDIITVRAFASQAINSNGYYEVPLNLQNNPLNSKLDTFTLGEVSDHVSSIITNLPTYVTTVKDLGNVTPYGTRFVQHSGPMSLALYHITSEEHNVIKAVKSARDDYASFKRNFVSVAESLGVDADPVTMVDLVLQKLNANTPNTAPYYFSDMVPYGGAIITDLKVVDYRIKTYPLSKLFGLNVLSNQSVLVYWTSGATKIQLVHGRDYTFDDQSRVVITSAVLMTTGDTITTVEYDSTDGCFVPATPTKLGIWPAYIPKIYSDTTLITPQDVIQGHDGSIMLTYGDYRDSLLIELEKRIYNNIKVKYDPTVFDILDIIPGEHRKTSYSLKEFNNVLAPCYYDWANLVGINFTQGPIFDPGNSFTYNYQGYVSPDGTPVPGYWRGIYRWLLDTDRPNLCPWEMLGFPTEPEWWTTVYGPAPYTSNNLVMWQDLATGTIRAPNVPPAIIEKYARPFLLNNLPVGEAGELLSPLESGLAVGPLAPDENMNFIFGDVSPVEAAWRRSSYYPFSMLITSILLTPAKTFGLLLDRSRITRNLAGQLVYKDTNVRVTPSELVVPNIHASTSRIQTAGVINYIIDFLSNIIFSNSTDAYNLYKDNLKLMTAQLSYRLGAFTNKNQFNLLLESKTPLSSGSVFVPAESYDIFLNTSSPIKKLSYSGVIITKVSLGYEITGYSKAQPYFNYYEYQQSGATINVGGISESYAEWTPGQQYYLGQIVKYSNVFYRATVANNSAAEFNINSFAKLAELPIIGGVTAQFRSSWDTSTARSLPYGTQLTSIQEVVDFLLGYEQWLNAQGFVFNNYNTAMEVVTNWETSAKEFMFWTSQNWSSGQEKWSNWVANNSYAYGTIVKYNGRYYSAQYNILPSEVFEEIQWAILPGLSSIGSSVISLSPAAAGIEFSTINSVVDSIGNPFNDYEIFKVDGTPFQITELDSYREGNTVRYSSNTSDGIYCASFYLVQNEHVAIIDNVDIFNDAIYNLPSGYRRDRIKLSAYITTGWYGGLDIPGFIFDSAIVQNWKPWQDYKMADVVLYQGYYYSANKFISGTSEFVPENWSRAASAPTAKLLPNWTNAATQFVDFYSLDVDNFNSQQQQFAQHLIGYQPRQYLNNIIKDSVSEFKFYQGMIREKGTQNVLNHLFGVLNADKLESLSFYEEWALRVGQYGANNAYDNIEIVLDDTAFKNNPQGFLLTPYVDTSITPFIIQQIPNDIYVKPTHYNSNPFPVLESSAALLRSSGYVNPTDVKFSLQSIDSLATQDITKLNNGDYVWCAFEGASWNVYRFTDLLIRVIDVAYDDVSVLTITTTNIVPLKVGQYVGLAQIDELNGFYKVTSVTLNSFTVDATIASFPSPFTQSEQLVIFALITQRTTSIDTLDNLTLTHLTPNALVWTDDDGAGKWATWKYKPVYTQSTLKNLEPEQNLEFGRVLAINNKGNILAAGTGQGTIAIYVKSGTTVPWVRRDTIATPFLVTHNQLNPATDVRIKQIAETIAISPDGTWLVSGSPTVGYVSTHHVGAWATSGTAYTIDDVVNTSQHTFYKAIKTVTLTSPQTVTVDSQILPNPVYWEEIPYISVSQSGSNSTIAAQGVVSLYKKDVNNIYSLVDSFVSAAPQANEQFGASVAFSDSSLYIGAPGNTSDQGRVYKLSYKTTIHVVTNYNPVGSINNIVSVTSTSGIAHGMIIQGTGFTSGQIVDAILSDTKISLNGTPDSTPAGDLSFVTIDWGYDVASAYNGAQAGSRLGNSIAVTPDNSLLLISSSGGTELGTVDVYKNLTLLQTFTGTTPNFGISTTIAKSKNYIAIADDASGTQFISQQGGVEVYEFSDTEFVHYQSLVNHRPETNGLFGHKILFTNNDKSIVVYNRNGDSSIITHFDAGTTTFDKSSTNFITPEVDSGRVDIYDRYNARWVFSESLASDNHAGDGYGTGVAATSNCVVVSAPYAPDTSLDSGLLYEYLKRPNSLSWTIDKVQTSVPNINKIKKAFLYDKKLGKLLTYLDVVDPLQGKIPGPADEELTFKTFYDPAIYGMSNGVAADLTVTTPWDIEPVGQLWWDLRTAKFVENNFDDPAYRNNSWNILAPGASIDVYEWVASIRIPSDWDALADTPAGLALGISGTSLYGDEFYSMTQNYDSTSKTFKNTYYFWVKNKKIVPANVPGRNIAASAVTSLITSPRGDGYTCLAITGTNSFSLINSVKYLKKTDTVLSIEYWTTDKIDRNIHSQYKLVSNDPIVTLPAAIEQKWIDSLCGADRFGNLVPDPKLPLKLQYGVENRPRQGMFVNRVEALKEFVEGVNRIMISQQIVETRDISDFEKYEPTPTPISGLYDTTIDTDIELAYVNIGSFTSPALTPVISDGKIVGINIVSSGSGYVYPPYISITGSGEGAKIQATINVLGQITGANIINSGEGYTDSTVCSIRNYSALVLNDTQQNSTWSIYEYDLKTQTWNRSLTQAYNVRDYWSKVDWYNLGYNQFTASDYIVNTFADLSTIDTSVKVGNIVKVLMVNTGGWLLLEKYTDSNGQVSTVDWSQSYKTVGIENGTIQLNTRLYDFRGTAVGYDSTIFDTAEFDVQAEAELRIILTAIKNKILIGNLKQYYLDLFFSSIRYAHSEQPFIDWIFKTSFVRATHTIGQLDQPVNYPIDNLSNFQDYIAEVKPYRTKVREYISQFNGVPQQDGTDWNYSAVSDFDLQPVYDTDGVHTVDAFIQNNVVTGEAKINQYPWKNWTDNVGFSVTEIRIINGGSGYATTPQVVISEPTGPNATIASAIVYLTNGTVNRVVLLSKGAGYLTAPTVTINGGLGIGGTQATAVAILGNSAVRSNLTELKFDRTDQTYYVSSLDRQETATGTGSRIQFPLTWAPDIKVGTSKVLVNGIPELREEYKLIVVKSKINGYTQYSGSIIFTTAPKLGSTIVISYKVDISALTAADRVQYYYNPTSGQLGKSLAQLMTGIDYGGVIVSGLGFNVPGGWDDAPFLSDTWDSRDPTFKDYYVEVAANTRVFVLPYTPASGTRINIYYVQKQKFSFTSTGVETGYVFDPYLTNPSVTVTSTTSTVGIASTYVPAGSAGFKLKVVSTAGIVPGMTIFGTGFTLRQQVISVANTTTLNISAVPDSTPDGVLTFANVAGSFVLTVANIDGINVGDVVATPAISAFAFQTKVAQVDPINNCVTLDQIIYENIPANTEITFTKSLVQPTDVIINANGTLFLTDTYPAGAVIDIAGTYDPIRLDDPDFDKVSSGDWEISHSYAVNTVINVMENRYICKVAHTSSTVFTDDYYVGKWRIINPLAILNTPVLGVSVITEVIDGGAAALTLVYTTQDGGPATLTPPVTEIEADIINDNVANVLEIPDFFIVGEGDEFIIRQEDSDGSIPLNAADYDTELDGGNLAYSSATGLAADDIVLDGDGFVTLTSSPAPEEVVPGQVVDTLAVKVYDRITSGSANIRVNSHLADGIASAYDIGQQANSPRALIVKIDSLILTHGTDYTIDYRNSQVAFLSTPVEGSFISVFSIGYNGTHVLDLDYFIGDGVTTEFVTKASWVASTNSLVYVDGVISSPALFKTDSSYEFTGAIGLKFGSAPAAGALINYIIVSGAQQTFAITKTETIPTDGSLTYALQYPIGKSLPNETNMIVRVDQEILQAPNNSYFTIGKNKLTYTIDSSKAIPHSVNVNNILVYANGNLLRFATDYTVDPAGISVKLIKSIYSQYSGKQLVISIIADNGYFYNPVDGAITFTQSYDNTHTIEVISSFRHDVLDIERTTIEYNATASLTPDTVEFYTYNNIGGGLIKLDRKVIDNNYVWVMKNGSLLTPSIDYKLLEDYQSIQLATSAGSTDTIELMTFGSNVLETAGIAYMQFKDMLNKVTYLRLNANKKTTLMQDLHWNDTSIVVEDAGNLDVPNTANNKPGIIEIRGERIEYFKVEGNVLSQLRRGTKGTGVYNLNKAGTYVQCIGTSEVIPYNDTIQSQTVMSAGSKTINLNFVPANKDAITVFVGGYNNASAWEPNTVYAVENIVTVGAYTYKCIIQHTSSTSFVNDSANWSFFVPNIRLQKDAYSVFNINKAPYSPAGDVDFPADFYVDGTTPKVTLTNLLSFGTKVTVVAQTGLAWDSTTNILNDNSEIARFIKAVPGIWYTEPGALKTSS